MKFAMAKNSLFAILLRSPWWASVAIALVVAMIARLALPAEYVIYGVSGAFPFAVIAAITAWRQWRAPSAARVADTVHAAQAMSWTQFSNALEQAFRRDGHAVSRLPGPAADFELLKAGRTTLVSCKRWKGARLGIEPLRELQAARRTREAEAAIVVTLGELTDNARAYAAEQRIDVMQGTELAVLLGGN